MKKRLYFPSTYSVYIASVMILELFCVVYSFFLSGIVLISIITFLVVLEVIKLVFSLSMKSGWELFVYCNNSKLKAISSYKARIFCLTNVIDVTKTSLRVKFSYATEGSVKVFILNFGEDNILYKLDYECYKIKPIKCREDLLSTRMYDNGNVLILNGTKRVYNYLRQFIDKEKFIGATQQDISELGEFEQLFEDRIVRKIK